MQSAQQGGLGFITPHFQLEQTQEFVIVAIRLPSLRSTDEGEFYVLDKEFKFHLKPYFLRLTFRQQLVEDGRERAEHDIVSGTLRVWLPKANAGEHFEGLDMLTELLRRPTAKAASSRGGPLIEVVGSSSNDAGIDGAEDEEDESHDDAMNGDAFQVEQELPSLAVPSGASLTGVAARASHYGFNEAYSGVFVGLESEGLVQLLTPEQTVTRDARRLERIQSEEAAFDADYYMADFMEDDGAREAMQYVPWWRSEEAQRWRARGDTAAGTGTAAEVSEGGAASSPLPPGAPATLSRPSPFGIGSDYQQALLTLPRKEFLLTAESRRRSLHGLVDLLFAYAYDVRTTQGDPTVESGWTIRRLSSLLSFLDGFDSVLDATVACARRSFCYPLVRHFELTKACIADVAALLWLGPPAVLRALLDVRSAVQRNDEYGYLLNRIWLDDYCVWLQQLRPTHLKALAESVQAVALRKDMLSWPLEAYEQLARQSTDEEGAGLVFAGSDSAAALEATMGAAEGDDDDDDDDDSSSEVSGDSSDDDSGGGLRMQPSNQSTTSAPPVEATQEIGGPTRQGPTGTVESEEGVLV
jgi:protein SHQ1